MLGSEGEEKQQKERGRPKKKAKKSEDAVKGVPAIAGKELQKECKARIGKHFVMNIERKTGEKVQMFGTIHDYKPTLKQYVVRLYKTEEARSRGKRSSKTLSKPVDEIISILQEEEDDDDDDDDVVVMEE